MYSLSGAEFKNISPGATTETEQRNVSIVDSAYFYIEGEQQPFPTEFKDIFMDKTKFPRIQHEVWGAYFPPQGLEAF